MQVSYVFPRCNSENRLKHFQFWHNPRVCLHLRNRRLHNLTRSLTWSSAWLSRAWDWFVRELSTANWMPVDTYLLHTIHNTQCQCKTIFVRFLILWELSICKIKYPWNGWKENRKKSFSVERDACIFCWLT